ncbi:MAG: phycobilisome linker polypeptide [Cyanobacteria bacterium P01_D01_bin.105]
MLGKYSAGVGGDRRIFVYEVNGLHQNEVTQRQNIPIRSSHSQFIQVPFERMSEAMQRITRMKGQIVNIFPLGDQPATDNAETAAASAPTESEAD